MTTTIEALMDELGMAKEPHPEAEELFARIEAHCGARLTPGVAAFLRRSLHQAGLDAGEWSACTWEPQLVADWSWDTEHDDAFIGRTVIFADDEGDFVFLFDPANRVGFGPDAVYWVEKGSMSLDAIELVAPDLATFLRHCIRKDGTEPRRVLELRDEQTSHSTLPLRLGNGHEIAADAVTDPRFFPGVDVLRSVRLARPLTIGDRTFVPDPDPSEWAPRPDLQFFLDGRVARGYLAGGEVDGIPIAPGSWIHWKSDGELHLFTLADRCVIGGIACRAGAQIVRRASKRQFFFTPDEDTEYLGYPCKAGHKVDDYGPGLGLHFTSARRFKIADRATVPRDVAVTITSGGGARFELVAATMLDGRPYAAGTSLWYDGDGKIREVYAPKKPAT